MTTLFYRHNALFFKAQSSPVSDTLLDHGCTPTMPSTFLMSKERERLVCFPDDIQPWDLITSFTLTAHDCSLIDP